LNGLRTFTNVRRAGTKNKLGANEGPKAPSMRRQRRRWERSIGRGCPPPVPTRGSGERRELPQRGPGRSPGAKQNKFGTF